jgi:hypothetical protein
MCFSERVSWLTFALSMAGIVAVLVARKDNPEATVLALALVAVGAMQAFEALLWRDSTNTVTAHAAMLVNHLQPIILWALSRRFLTVKNPEAARIADVLLTVYLAAMTMHSVDRYRGMREMVTLEKNGLHWSWNYGPYSKFAYTAYLALACTTVVGYFQNPLPIVTVILGTYMTSHVMYANRGMIGSMWCFYGAFLPWLLLLMPK